MQKNEMFATVKTIRNQLKMMQQMSSDSNSLFDMSAISGEEERIGALRSKLDELLLVCSVCIQQIVFLGYQRLLETQRRQGSFRCDTDRCLLFRAAF